MMRKHNIVKNPPILTVGRFKYFIGRYPGEHYRIRRTDRCPQLEDTIWQGDDYFEGLNFLEKIAQQKRIEAREKREREITQHKVDKKYEEALKFNEKWDLICGKGAGNEN